MSFAPATGKDTMTPHDLPHRIWPVGVPSGHSMLLVQSSSCRPGVSTSNRQAAEVMSSAPRRMDKEISTQLIPIVWEYIWKHD